MQDQQFHKSVRISDSKRDAILNRLCQGAKDTPEAARRACSRIEYRVPEVAVMITHPGGGVGRFIVCVRNISMGGMSFLHGGFVHPGAEILAMLPLKSGERIAITGTVARCQHIEGALHEIGVCFRERLDISNFLSPGQTDSGPEVAAWLASTPRVHAEILCVCETAAEAERLTRNLRPAGIAPVIARQAGQARDQLSRQPFDVVVVDLDDAAGADAIRSLRMAGHDVAIIAMTSEAADQPEDPDDAAGVVVKLRKPHQPHDLIRTIVSLLGPTPCGPSHGAPIYSDLAPSAHNRELIAQYVSHVQATVRQISRGIEQNNLDKIRRCCQMLKATAAGYGFPQLTDAAASAVKAIEQCGSARDAATEVKRVEAVARRLRARRSAA